MLLEPYNDISFLIKTLSITLQTQCTTTAICREGITP